MIISFNHPIHGISCTAEYDIEGKTVIFDIVEYEEAKKKYATEVVEEVRQWCMRNAINCDSVNRANVHLVYLGINERFR
jgi:hypothetical protein